MFARYSSDDRAQRVDRVSTGLVYTVPTTGVTGGKTASMGAISKYLSRAPCLVHNKPLLVWFGIRTSLDMAESSEVVGSAVIERIAGFCDDPDFAESQRLDRLRRSASSLKATTTIFA